MFVVENANHRVQKFVVHDVTETGPSYKAILLAGGGPPTEIYHNRIWKETKFLADKAKQALRAQGFREDKIKYLTAGEILKGQNSASLTSLQQAITNWAADATDVIIYLADHGGPGQFQINATEILDETQLSQWVAELDEQISGKITVIIESCKSGSFLDSLAAPDRYLIASANADQAAVISNGGVNAFSYFFWSEIGNGADLSTAFKAGRQAMNIPVGQLEPQDAQLDSNGNKQFNEADDFTRLNHYCLRNNCIPYAAAAPPTIQTVTSPRELNGNTEAILSMEVVVSTEEIKKAWVVITQPGFQHIDSNEPISELTQILLHCNQNNICATTYTEFNLPGEYQLTFYVQDNDDQMARPVTTKVTQKEEQPSMPSLVSTATYDDQSNILWVDDLFIAGHHYQVEFIHSGDFIFSIYSIRKLDAPLLQYPNLFDINRQRVILHRVLVSDRYYRVNLKNRGNNRFHIDLLEKLF